MIRTFFCFAFLCLSNLAFTQDFPVEGNGLMYSERTIGQLRHIVDSLHLRYKVCDLNPRYNSFWQCTGHKIYLDTLVEQAEKDLNEGMNITDFVVRYPMAEIDTQMLAVAFYDRDEKAHQVRLFPDGGEVILSAAFLQFSKVKAGDRDIQPYKNRKLESRLSAFLFTSGWKSSAIPTRWATMIQYGECMIDTSTTTFLTSLDSRSDTTTITPARDRFFKIIAFDVPLPQQGDGYWEKKEAWDAERKQHIKKVASQNPDFQNSLNLAVEEAVRLKLPDEDLERSAAEYLSAEQRLALMRLRIVIGFCSQDGRPREHAKDVAVLAAETGTWEVFLRAHLDIMNDRFHRASDGSYAWGKRGTYLAELEALELDIPQLLLGTIFRAENLAENHYFGSVGRIGRALAESKKRDAVETLFKEAIADPQLDTFNRLLCYYAYSTMISWKYPPGTPEENDRIKQQVKDETQAAAALLPTFLRGRVDN